LHVDGNGSDVGITIKKSDTINFRIIAQTGTENQLVVKNQQTGAFPFKINTDAITDSLVLDGGNVGINDTTPDYKLEVLDTVTQLAITNVDGTNWTEFYVDGSGNLNIDASGGTTSIHGALSINDIYTFPTDDGSSSQFLQTDGAGNLTWATSSGSGDITDVGDCTDGACFGGAATGGTQLTFYNAGGNGILSYNGDFNFDKQVGNYKCRR
jgi:hypothetical protein